ncbi:hypothetical protein PIB30_021875 [Stylosanthes scabra]|uniref:Complex 1 LYR protein domain-containing protein n=1 Tax=Stylosanthes scabra TaxID=79078 RepID=A0ABU6R9M0_9FABA|nr:hypothetical protein [Stylosanthes scabra]
MAAPEMVLSKFRACQSRNIHRHRKRKTKFTDFGSLLPRIIYPRHTLLLTTKVLSSRKLAALATAEGGSPLPVSLLLQNHRTELNNVSIVRHNKMRSGASRGQRLSGMQKQVLSLYRGFLRAARSKSDEDRHRIESIVSDEFRRNSTEVDRKNFQYIEYLLRRGKKQLDQLKSPGTTGLTSLKVDLSRTNKTNS